MYRIIHIRGNISRYVFIYVPIPTCIYMHAHQVIHLHTYRRFPVHIRVHSRTPIHKPTIHILTCCLPPDSNEQCVIGGPAQSQVSSNRCDTGSVMVFCDSSWHSSVYLCIYGAIVNNICSCPPAPFLIPPSPSLSSIKTNTRTGGIQTRIEHIP